MINLGCASTFITLIIYDSSSKDQVISPSKSIALNASCLPRYSRDSYDSKSSYLTVFTRSATLTKKEYEIKLKICKTKNKH